MITFKCKMCGGDLSFEQGASVAECPYCGTNQTLPKLDDDKRANLYDRANHFRRQNEYDKAMAIYEQILAEDRTDAEAYWSLVLCRYGIEYVEDPASRKRVPTVNRVQYASILADEDYKSALANADAAQRGVYEAEASAIAEIQRGILDISKQEEPFDVFICYKETDANGRRTPDSVLATELYHELTKEGFKVFFARITLEDKIGSAYEPYIFAALNSARVMVALGTKPEHFNAVWVKNEWSRYLTLIKSGADKTLVPAYRDMDPYDLPEEFAHLQAQDMGKLGFMQDLIRGIKKILKKDEQKRETVTQPTAAPAGNVAPLLERTFMFLEDGDWSSADEYAEKVLDLDPKNVRAYLGKLMAQLRVRREEDMKNQAQSFDGNSHYQKIMRFGDEKLKAQLQADIEFIRNRNEKARQKEIYDRASEMLQRATTVDQCLDAKRHFESILDFEGDKRLQAACDSRIEEINRLAALRSEAIEKVNALRREMDQKTEAIRKAYDSEMQAWQSAERRYRDAIDALKRARQRRDDTATLLSRAQGELQSLRGLFVGKRRREMEAWIEEYRQKLNQVEKEIPALEIALTETEAARHEKPAGPDITDERELNYCCAQIYREAHMYEEAWKLYSGLKGYKDVDSIIENDVNIAAAAAAAWRAQFALGNTVQYGHYEQDNDTSNDAEAIEWIVLANDGETTTLISRYGLDAVPYNTERESVTWETCTLRKWLNEEFLNAAFSVEERARLETVTVTADKNPKYDTIPGGDTRDTVFLLSIDEANRLFSGDCARSCRATAYAKARRAGVDNNNGNCAWWLRSPGRIPNFAAYVISDGSFNYGGNGVGNVYVSVRPVIVLRLS